MRELLLVVCLLAAGTAVSDAQSSPSPVAPPTPPQPASTDRTTTTLVAVGISLFSFLLFLCGYIKKRCRRDHGVTGVGGGPSRRGKRGLDPAVVATFPIVRYRDIVGHKIGKGVLECAVCLTPFEGSDDIRLLPHCSHAFHPECIDPWLQARVTCPLCRTNLEKPPPPLAAAAPPPPPEAVAIQVVDDTDESDEDVGKEEAMELEMLRSARRAARMPRSHSTGHSLFAVAAASAEEGDHERFTCGCRRTSGMMSSCLARSLINLSDVSSVGSSRGGRRAGAGGFGNTGRWQRLGAA